MEERAVEDAAEKKSGAKWYFSTLAIVTGFLVVGPFVLPLVWLNPQRSRRYKIVATALVAILTAMLMAVAIRSMQSIGDLYRLIQTP